METIPTSLINSEDTNFKNNDLDEPMELDGENEVGEEGELSESSDENTIQKHSRYENKEGGFITGINLFQKDDDSKLEERAKRFSLDPKNAKPITEEQINELYLSMGLNNKESENKHVRLTALHMRGTDELSTKDIFSYFQDFAPSSIEWINDTSCNVVWLDELSAARALLVLSKPIIGTESQTKSEEDEEELLKQMKIKEIQTKEGEVIMVVNEDTLEVSQEVLLSTIEAPIPPGKWRLGNKHPKAKVILLRFATKSDKKPPNAEKMSEYYRKHGNPNYGGIKGLITNSRKRKIRGIPPSNDNKNPWGDLAKNWNNNTNSTTNLINVNNKGMSSKPRPHVNQRIGNKIAYPSSDSSDSDDINWSSRAKIPRMRMRADEEEAKVEKRKAKTKKYISIEVNRSAVGSVHDLRNKLGRDKHEIKISESESDNEYINSSRDLRNTLRGRSRPGGSIKDNAQDLRSKLTKSRNDKKLFREKSPLQIEFDNDQYYEIVGSDQD